MVTGEPIVERVGLTKTKVGNQDVIGNRSGYARYNYRTSFSPFQRGAEIEAVIYISDDDIYPTNIFPSLIGYMLPNSGLNYWSFGIMGERGNRKIAFYGWSGAQNTILGVADIPATGWVKLNYKLDSNLILSVNEKVKLTRAMSDTELSAFVRNQNPTTPVPLTLFKHNGGVITATKLSYLFIA